MPQRKAPKAIAPLALLEDAVSARVVDLRGDWLRIRLETRVERVLVRQVFVNIVNGDFRVCPPAVFNRKVKERYTLSIDDNVLGVTTLQKLDDLAQCESTARLMAEDVACYQQEG